MAIREIHFKKSVHSVEKSGVRWKEEAQRTIINQHRLVLGQPCTCINNILGISSTKLKGNGAKNMDDCYVVYSGVTEGRSRAGVVVFLSEDVSRCVKSWQCVNERIEIVVVKLKIDREWSTLVQVYAPTDDSKREEKERFHCDLQVAVNKVGRKETMVLMGDFNARVGKDCEACESVIDRNGEEVKNDSRDRLLRFCAVNDMLVMKSWFQHKDIHKFMWVCPGFEEHH